MQVNKVQVNNQQTFGMALRKPSSKKIAKKISMNAAKQVDIATPFLEKIADKKDLELSLIKSKDFRDRGFLLTISEEVKNPLKRFFDIYPRFSIRVLMGEIPYGTELSEILEKRAQQLEQHFDNFNNC